MTSSGPRPSKNEKREHAREQARVFREQQAARQRRRRLFTQGGIAVVVIIAVVVVTIVIVNANHASNVAKAKQTSSGPANMASDGILMKGSGGTITAVTTPAIAPKSKPVATNLSSYPTTANIVEYVDYQCPFCDQFESANATQIDKWVAAGKATVEIHPLSFLDASSQGNRYSSRAANAVACVAQYDPNDFLKVTKALYAKQPAEGTSGMDDTKLISIVAGAGGSSKKIASCIAGESFKSWVSAATARANISVFGGTVDSSKISTPTVFVNGKQWNPSSATSLTDPAEFAAFVESVKPGATS
jgi:protein-disulfide isomerase